MEAVEGGGGGGGGRREVNLVVVSRNWKTEGSTGVAEVMLCLRMETRLGD